MFRKKQPANYCVYVLIDPRPGFIEVFYVGLSRRVEGRFKSHLKKAANRTHKNERLGQRLRAILHSKALPACVILFNHLTGEQAALVERELIAKFHSGHNLLNLTSGGELGTSRKKKKKKSRKLQDYISLWGLLY